jgi:hypothetical protein
VVIPATAPYKSANRAIEAIRQGCFVVAEPHPALEGFPIYIGNIKHAIRQRKPNSPIRLVPALADPARGKQIFTLTVVASEIHHHAVTD